VAVYFIREDVAEGSIKIGTTVGDPLARLAALRTGNPRPLRLLVAIPGGTAEEKALHERFKDLRLEGEWFRPAERLLGFVEALRYAHGAPNADTAERQTTFLGLTRDQLQMIAGFVTADDAWNATSLLDFINPESVPFRGNTESELVALRDQIDSVLGHIQLAKQKDHPRGLGAQAHPAATDLLRVFDRVEEILSAHYSATFPPDHGGPPVASTEIDAASGDAPEIH
jgi:hypothetical protein